MISDWEQRRLDQQSGALLDRLANRLAADQKTVAERKWRSPLKPSKPQVACDEGLFGDGHKQQELF